MAVESATPARTKSYDELTLIGGKANVDVIGEVRAITERYLLVIEALDFHLPKT